MDPLTRYLFGVELNAWCKRCPGTLYWIDFTAHRQNPIGSFGWEYCALCETEDIVYSFEERYYRRW